MSTALQLAQIVISVVLIVLIVLQGKGSGLGSMFGGDAGMGIARTRRGLEKTLFQLTVGLAILFFVIAIATPYF